MPLSSLGDLPDPGIESAAPPTTSSALQADSLTAEPLGKPGVMYKLLKCV